MTWPEICEELVKRWPDEFEYGHGELIAVRTSRYGALLYADSIDNMQYICTAIGAVVWSVPRRTLTDAYGWRAKYYCTISPEHEYHGDLFPTRAEAELAALGAWLEATR